MMKLRYSLLIASICLSACGSSVKQEQGTDEPTTQIIHHLTRETMKEQVVDFDSDTWQYKGQQPCIIDFYADWCAPCKVLAPTLQKVAERYNDKIKVYKVNIDQEKELAQAFGVQSIPTLFFCPMSGNPYIHRGLLADDGFEHLISHILLPKRATANE